MTMWCESTPRAASWKPTLIVSSGTLKSFHDFVRPARISACARSRLCRPTSAAYAWW
jgi:hypothetical protein